MNITFSFYPEGKRKALTMSYDDGQIHDRKLVELFNRYGVRGTFHLNSFRFDQEGFLTASETPELFRGHEISAHSYHHPSLTMIPDLAVRQEILEDRAMLEKLAGYIVRGMSYPFGTYNDHLLSLLPALGIEYSRTVLSHGSFQLPENFLTWHPTCHHNQDLQEKAKTFQNLPKWALMPLFYVWGHSYEFPRDNNWDMVEEFLKQISGDDQVWYATNIEIMDYIKAVRAVKFGADGKIAFNPSSIPVWIGVDGEAVKIGAGQCLAL